MTFKNNKIIYSTSTSVNAFVCATVCMCHRPSYTQYTRQTIDIDTATVDRMPCLDTVTL